MSLTARLLAALAVIFCIAGCSYFAITPTTSRPPPPREALPPGALLPSPNLLVGRIIAMDAASGLAFVEVASAAPTAALAEGTELVARTEDLHPTARLTASRYLRGRTLGAKIVSGQPAPGNEVVWPTP